MAQRSRIVILGGGFAGAFCAQRLCRALKPEEAEVVLVDRHNYFAFTPLLIEAGIGALEPRHTIVPIRSFVGRGRFLMAEATGVDTSRRSVSALIGGESEIDLAYDHLVLAMGTVSRPPRGPGMERAMPLKHLSDAVALRDRAVRMLEMASAEPDSQRRRSMLRMIVIGGNFTGVEAAGEFHAFLQRAAGRYPSLDPSEVGVTLCELGDRLLDGLDDNLAAYAEQSMRTRGVDIRLGDTVESYQSNVATLASGERLGARTIIWAAGNAPNPLLEKIDLPRDDKGYLRARPDMRIEGCEEVWGVGDCAVNPDPDGSPYPPTAQMAVQQGRAVADNLARPARPRDEAPGVRVEGLAGGSGLPHGRGEGDGRLSAWVRGVVAVADGVPAEDAGMGPAHARRDGLDAGPLHAPGHRRTRPAPPGSRGAPARQPRADHARRASRRRIARVEYGSRAHHRKRRESRCPGPSNCSGATPRRC